MAAERLLIGVAGPAISPAWHYPTALRPLDRCSRPVTLRRRCRPVERAGQLRRLLFDGADLNLDALVPLISHSGPTGGTTITSLDVPFRGYLRGQRVAGTAQKAETYRDLAITTPAARS